MAPVTRRFLLVLLMIASLPAALPQADSGAIVPAQRMRESRRVRAVRISEAPVFDGLVQEPLWEAIEPATDFIQQEPHEGQPATERTEVRFAYDDRTLYVGIICFDSDPAGIVVTQNRRDAVLTDTDSVQILLDTFHDHQNAFVFGTSPTGIEYDAQVSKAGLGRGGAGMPARAGGQGSRGAGSQRGGAAALNLNWDGVWWVRSQVTPRGWEAEMVIPLKTLRYRPGQERVWGLNIMRNLRRRNEQSFWAPVSRAFYFTQVELAGQLEGLTLAPQRNLKLLPYVLGGLKQDYASGAPSRFARNGGLDVKYSLSSSLTLDFTVNTDFAQVEVDEEQVNLTRFDLFFPEKRPFFLENSGFFEFGTPREIEIFFSRRIGIDPSGVEVPIDAGLRLSGKLGPYQLGMLNMQTSEVPEVAPANNFSVVRVSRELRNRSSIGLIGVNRSSTTRSETRAPFNRTVGADANFGFGRYANWFNYAAKTETPGLNGRDHAYASAFEYDNEHHLLDLGWTEVGEAFNPEVGFVRRVGYRKPSFGYRYTAHPEGRHLRSWSPHFQVNRWYTIGTNRLESGFDHYHFDTRWQNGGRVGIAWNRNFERLDAPFKVHRGVFIPPGRYSFHEVVLNYMTDPTAPLFADGNFSAGGFYRGSIRTINVNGGYRHGQNVTLSGGYLRNFIRLPEGNFHVDLASVRFNWSFTPKSYLQSLIQYNSQDRQIGANIRLALLSTSSTGFFFVYNSRTLTGDYLDPHEIRRRTLSRVVYFKFNYLFDF